MSALLIWTLNSAVHFDFTWVCEFALWKCSTLCTNLRRFWQNRTTWLGDTSLVSGGSTPCPLPRSLRIPDAARQYWTSGADIWVSGLWCRHLRSTRWAFCAWLRTLVAADHPTWRKTNPSSKPVGKTRALISVEAALHHVVISVSFDCQMGGTLALRVGWDNERRKVDSWKSAVLNCSSAAIFRKQQVALNSSSLPVKWWLGGGGEERPDGLAHLNIKAVRLLPRRNPKILSVL